MTDLCLDFATPLPTAVEDHDGEHRDLLAAVYLPPAAGEPPAHAILFGTDDPEWFATALLVHDEDEQRSTVTAVRSGAPMGAALLDLADRVTRNAHSLTLAALADL